MNPIPKSLPNLYLVGFMATGKSTIGRRLAEDMGLRFIDSDRAIEELEGRSIPQIFAESGEAYFRQLERDFIQSGHPDRNHIIACGGGLVVQPGMLELLESKGVVICLSASIQTIVERVAHNKSRPLLNDPDPEARIRSLLAEREPIYDKVSTCIMTDQRPTWEVVFNVKRAYLSSAGRNAAFSQ